VLDPLEASQGGAFRDRCHHEHRGENLAYPAVVLAPVQDKLPILTERLELVFGKLHHGGLHVVTITR
jgi:hypothetical protein